MNEKIRIGISSCLLGENVRFDGGHKLDRFLRDTLGQYVEYVGVCPEVECGFTVPREPMRLVGDPVAPKLLTVRTGQDHTERMKTWALRRVKELEKEELCGYIFKSGSPSSGMERVKIYDANGVPSKVGVGLFAQAFMDHFPLLPVEEEGRLHDSPLRENFIERIFVLKRWRDVLASGRKLSSLVDFHTRHKLLIMSHSNKHLKDMGALVAKAKGLPKKGVFQEYFELLMGSLKLRATVNKHTNVLMHVMGYFKRALTADEKKELLEVIENYHQQYVPLIVPITLLNHYVRKYEQPYLKEQYYLNPHPVELQLRNHV
ncbi:MAG TPA: DUF523 and DUF1722 domain-containing protein [bacterium]|nr:DUF523 and DUF1722 domain-containing protein [bacterium]